MTDLSPAARAVAAAFRERYEECWRPGPFPARWRETCLADALRKLTETSGRAFLTWEGQPTAGSDYISVLEVLAIADRLDEMYMEDVADE